MPINISKQYLLDLPRSVKRALVIASDFFICIFSSWFSFGLRSDQWGFLQGGQWFAVSFAIVISFPAFIYFGLYRTIFRYAGSAAFITLLRVFTLYSLIYFCIFTLIGIQGVPRSIGVIQPILLFIGIGASRYLARSLFGRVHYSKNIKQQVMPAALIYGAGSAGRQLLAGILTSNEILVKGFLDDNHYLRGNTINGVEVYGTDDLSALILRLHVTHVLLAIPSASQTRRSEIISSLIGCGVKVRSLPGLLDLALGKANATDLHDLDMEDLLGRPVVPPNYELLEKNVKNKIILVTGSGGSIGSELCRQLIKFSPKLLILIDSSEYALYQIYEELKYLTASLEGGFNSSLQRQFSPKIIPRLASICNLDLMYKIFINYKPDTVFHAAAYKHVPLVEQNAVEGISNNVYGTYNCALAALECGASNFILVSTDKAVRPTNIMGASKRVAEMLLQAMAKLAKNRNDTTVFSMVRFGNVLGSSGSVVPLFNKQIQAGGPITLTHLDIIRFFMTIPEAAQLVIQSSAMANGGDVFVLDMGQPVRIYDLAVKMVHLSGLSIKEDSNPLGDIEIVVTGLRPGEKLYEELLIGNDPQLTAHPKIMRANEYFLPWDELEPILTELKQALNTSDTEEIRTLLKKLVPEYHY